MFRQIDLHPDMGLIMSLTISRLALHMRVRNHVRTSIHYSVLFYTEELITASSIFYFTMSNSAAT